MSKTKSKTCLCVSQDGNFATASVPQKNIKTLHLSCRDQTKCEMRKIPFFQPHCGLGARANEGCAKYANDSIGEKFQLVQFHLNMLNMFNVT